MRTVKIFLYLAYPAAEGKEFLPFAQKKKTQANASNKIGAHISFLAHGCRAAALTAQQEKECQHHAETFRQLKRSVAPQSRRSASVTVLVIATLSYADGMRTSCSAPPDNSV